jgi:hypothetical protein
VQIDAKLWFRSIYQDAHGGALWSLTPSVKIYVVNFIAIYVHKPRRRHLQRASSTVLLLHSPASTPTTGRATVHDKLRQLHRDPICIDRAQRSTLCTGRLGRLVAACINHLRRSDARMRSWQWHVQAALLDRSCSHAQGDKSRPTPTTSARLML